MYILFYLSNRKQCVRINNTYSEFENIITGVTLGSMLGLLLFSLSINHLFFFILIASKYNFADDNTLAAFAENVSRLINIWFKKKLNDSKPRQVSSNNN